MLTGKAKEDFEKWYVTQIKRHLNRGLLINGTYLEFFYKMPSTIKDSFYIGFFDTTDIEIQIVYKSFWGELEDRAAKFISQIIYPNYINQFEGRTRNEARTKAIEKACEIYNEKTK